MKVGSLRASVGVPVKIRQCNFEKGKAPGLLKTNFLYKSLWRCQCPVGLDSVFIFWSDSLEFQDVHDLYIDSTSCAISLLINLECEVINDLLGGV
jgi:hypothetical protein